MISITESAKNKIVSLMKADGLDESYFVRVGAKGGGCAGIQYFMEFNNEIKNIDQVFSDDGIKIVCDERSLMYLFGTELDYSDGLNGKGFEWNNPNATRVCSCKSSFSV